MRNAFILILTLAVIALVIIGLINFDLLLTLTGKLIAAIVIIALLVISARLLFFRRRYYVCKQRSTPPLCGG